LEAGDGLSDGACPFAAARISQRLSQSRWHRDSHGDPTATAL